MTSQASDPGYQRQLERKRIRGEVLIEDEVAGHQVGTLVNVTVKGLMLMTSHSVATDSLFQYRLQLPESIDGCDFISVGVDCLWCEVADLPNCYWSGYQIIDISEADLSILSHLIGLYGY